MQIAYEGADTRGSRFFQQVKGTGDVGVHEVLMAVRGHMGLVQRRRMNDGANAAHAVCNEGAVNDRSERMGEWQGRHIDADHIVCRGLQAADERLAEMAGAAGHENLHGAGSCRREMTESLWAAAGRFQTRRTALRNARSTAQAGGALACA
jgi:hypothetical protein